MTAADLTKQDRRRLNGGVEQVLQKSAYSRDELDTTTWLRVLEETASVKQNPSLFMTTTVARARS